MDRVKNAFSDLKLNQKFTLVIMLIVVMPMVGFSIFCIEIYPGIRCSSLLRR